VTLEVTNGLFYGFENSDLYQALNTSTLAINKEADFFVQYLKENLQFQVRVINT
jgi:hypothetical protein